MGGWTANAGGFSLASARNAKRASIAITTVLRRMDGEWCRRSREAI